MSWMQILFSFEGRIGRAEFWLGTIGLILAQLVNMLILSAASAIPVIGGAFAILAVLATLSLWWMAAALGVKRCHDRDQSGWMLLVSVVPVIGGIWWLVNLGLLPGTDGANRFDFDPDIQIPAFKARL